MQNKTTCTWKFAAPPNYQFKLVVFAFTGTAKYLRLLDGNGNVKIIRNNTPDISGFPILIDGPYISITFHSDSYIEHLGQDEELVSFRAYLTINKIGSEKVDGKCILKDDNKIWTNLRTPHEAYSNNAYCSLNLTVNSTSMLIANINHLVAEYNVDILKYSIQDESVIISQQLADNVKTFVFQAFPNGYNSYVLWEFIADATYPSLGFEMSFEIMNCECSPNIIEVPCSSSIYTVMPATEIYCGNLHCNFTINIHEDCINQNLIIQISENTFGKGQNHEDNFQIKSNNNLLYSSNSEIDFYELLLPTNNTNISEFHTGPAKKLAHFQFTLIPWDVPQFLPTIYLTKAMPSKIIHLGPIPSNSVITIMLDNDLKNDVLELYANRLNLFTFFSIYDDDNLNFITASERTFETTNKDAAKYVPKTGKILIYKIQGFYQDIPLADVIYVRAFKENNCLFEGTVFDSTMAAEANETVAMTASLKANCEVILLNIPFYIEDENGFVPQFSYVMTDFWTNSYNESVKIYYDNEEDSNSPFIEYVSSNASTFSDVTLASQIYKIIIPKGFTMTINFKKLSQYIKIKKYPYKSSWANPFFGSLLPVYSLVSCGFFEVDEDVTAKITAKVVNGINTSENAVILIDANVAQIEIEHVGQVFYCTNTTILLFCSTDLTKNIAVLLEIEAFENSTATSSHAATKTVTETSETKINYSSTTSMDRNNDRKIVPTFIIFLTFTTFFIV